MKNKIEARFLVKAQGVEVKYEALKGEIWSSGYDERLYDTTRQLEDGEYVIMFEPDDGDGIEWIKVFKVQA